MTTLNPATEMTSPALILDVEDGEPEGFSLDPGRGQRFITRPADTENLTAVDDEDLPGERRRPEPHHP